MGFPIIDIRTIIIILMVGDVTAVAAIFAYRGISRQDRPTLVFMAGKACQAAAWILLSLRGAIPDSLSVFAGNVLLIGGFALEAAALGMTDGVDRRQYVVYGTIVFAGAVALAAMGSTPNGRVVAATAPAAAVYAALGFFMLKKGCSRLRAFIAIVAFLFAGVLSIRSIAAAVDRSFSLFSPAVIQTLSFMPLLVFLILGAVGFFFLLKERDDRLLRENEEKYRTVAEKATEAIVIVQDGKYVYANRQAGSMTAGGAAGSLIGSDFETVIWPADRAAVVDNYRGRLKGDAAAAKYEVRVIGPDGRPRWASISPTLIAWNSRPATLALITDIDELKRHQERVELLLREVNHRVKNNLNVAVSLLSLQSGAEGGKSADDVLRDAESRLRTMLELYESLHARESDGDLPLRAYLASIVDEIVLLYPRDPPVRVELDVDDTVLGAETLSALGLIVNELMTNSLKHAFAAAADPAIFIRARSAGGRVELSCGDNGIGISPDARPDATGGFGMRVVSMLASQLKADVRLAREKGTTWFFSFPGSAVRG